MTLRLHQSEPDGPFLGCIADDVTGATDLAINLVRGGFRVIQVIGIPTDDVIDEVTDVDAVVVALKTRSIPAADAIAQSREALVKLKRIGAKRFFFKYCSTFDSMPGGNIGQVAEAIGRDLGVDQILYCPAFPDAGRTVYQGHLFVGDRLLSESGMENHPLNPMTDANLPRFLRHQTEGETGVLPGPVIMQGKSNCVTHLQRLIDDGITNVVVDSTGPGHLINVAELASPMAFVTGGSGVARYLPKAYYDDEFIERWRVESTFPSFAGRSLILSGSCSNATNGQVAAMQSDANFWRVDVKALLNDSAEQLSKLTAWAATTDAAKPILVASTSEPSAVTELQRQHGGEQVAHAIETFFGEVAAALVPSLGIGKLILAGGETSGAVVNRLGIRAIKIGPEICAGVPWTEAIGFDSPLALALKSGNFGDVDFFSSALEMLA